MTRVWRESSSDSWNTGGHWTRKILYNSSGLVTDAYDARGVHTTFSYDDLNRVTQIGYSDSTPTAHYYYDSQSLPSGAPGSNVSLSWTAGSGASKYRVERKTASAGYELL